MSSGLDSLPPCQTAICGRTGGGLVINRDVALPKSRADRLIVRVVAVALNPSDIKMSAPKLVYPGSIAGSDFAGVVVDIGREAWSPVPIRIGDRVCGLVLGLHKLTPDNGAYAEYVSAGIVLKIPDSISFEEAASLSLGINTAGMALFHSLKVPGYPTQPAESDKTVLVYGGSTATGTIAIQMLALSGLQPITTCSPANFNLVKSYGAVEAFDYREKDCVSKIKQYTRNSLRYVLDCVSDLDTMQFCYSCIGRSGGQLTTLEPFFSVLNTRPKTVKLDWIFASGGSPLAYPPPFERGPDPELAEFTRTLATTAQTLLDEGKLRPHPIKTMEGGFQGIITGLQMLEKKGVSGQKLVYRVSS